MIKETEPFQADLGERPEFTEREKKQIAAMAQKREIVTCERCGSFIPYQAGTCYTCSNCGFQSKGCGQ